MNIYPVSDRMKPILTIYYTLALLICLLTMTVSGWPEFVENAIEDTKEAVQVSKEAVQGSMDMARAYNDMREANWKESDKYFHARGNYDAAQRGPGGAWAAEVLSDAREMWQGSVSGRGAEDTLADQQANKWGREGGDPNVYRPPGLPDEY